MAKLLGFSGSPIPNSNTDKAVIKILEQSGAEYEFIKLSKVHVSPCRACKACVNDNICKVKDDFPEISKKMQEADGFVFGTYTPYSMIDAFTKSLFERMWSMRHNKALNRGKLCVSVVSSMVPWIAEAVHECIKLENMAEDLIYVGGLTIHGNVPCISCGSGHTCIKSNALDALNGNPDGSHLFVKFEDQTEVYEKAIALGNLLKDKLS